MQRQRCVLRPFCSTLHRVHCACCLCTDLPGWAHPSFLTFLTSPSCPSLLFLSLDPAGQLCLQTVVQRERIFWEHQLDHLSLFYLLCAHTLVPPIQNCMYIYILHSALSYFQRLRLHKHIPIPHNGFPIFQLKYTHFCFCQPTWSFGCNVHVCSSATWQKHTQLFILLHT